MGETMDGRLVVHGVIYMEELEPLPSEVARNLFAVGGTTAATMAAKDTGNRRAGKKTRQGKGAFTKYIQPGHDGGAKGYKKKSRGQGSGRRR